MFWSPENISFSIVSFKDSNCPNFLWIAPCVKTQYVMLNANLFCQVHNDNFTCCVFDCKLRRGHKSCNPFLFESSCLWKLCLQSWNIFCFCFVWTILKLISLLRNVYKYIFQGFFLNRSINVPFQGNDSWASTVAHRYFARQQLLLAQL